MGSNLEGLRDGTEINNGVITSAKMLGIDMFGVTGAIDGSVPAAGTGQFYIQAGSSVGVFASNALDISFPTAFPNGLLTVVVVDGDSAADGNPNFGVNAGSTSKTAFRAQSPNNGTYRVNWIAVGF